MILRFAFGMLLGVLFFGGLWLTVRRLPTTRHPLGLTLGSLILRMSVVLGGIILVIDGRWQNAAAALAGFTAARIFLSVYTGDHRLKSVPPGLPQSTKCT